MHTQTSMPKHRRVYVYIHYKYVILRTRETEESFSFPLVVLSNNIFARDLEVMD